MSDRVHLLRSKRKTACGKQAAKGISYIILGAPWDDYSVVSCEVCKNFIHKLNQKAKGYRR